MENYEPSTSFGEDVAEPQQVIASHSHAGVGVLVARVPRSMGVDVRHARLPDNSAHCLIEGENTRMTCRLLLGSEAGPDDLLKLRDERRALRHHRGVGRGLGPHPR
jgi:hypothetical protein